MSDPYVIAHLTDVHLPTHGGFHPAELCGKRALSALNWARSRRRRHLASVANALRADILAAKAHHVAVTGDVVNFGLEREFLAGARWLDGFGDGADVSFTPGNHEAIHAGAAAARDAAFARFIATDAKADAKAGEDANGGDRNDGDRNNGEAVWPWIRRRGPVALVGVSTSIATPPFLAQGMVGARQLAGLRTALAKTRGACRIVLIHHPPTEMSRPRKALRDRLDVAAVIAEAGAELVLHGHNHKNQLSWIDGAQAPVAVLGAPSASTPCGAPGEPAEWRRIAITAADGGFAIDVLRRALGPDGRFADRGRFRLTAPRPT